MTKVYKIEKLNLPENLAKGFERFVVENKINEIIDWLNEHDESGRHVVPGEKIRELEGKRVSYPRDEKREKMAQDANYKNMPEYGEFWRNVKRSSIEEPKSGTHVGILLGDDEGVENVTYDGKEIWSKEPKSTLREATLKIVRTVADLQAEPVADKIISLFKDTLLKEVKKAEPLRIPGESLEFTSGQEWTMRQIKQIIKNL